MSDDQPFTDSKCVRNLCRWIDFESVSNLSNDPVNRDIADQLRKAGFDVELQFVSDREGVLKTNVVARMGPDDPASEDNNNEKGDNKAERRGGLAYFCHTDVVPAAKWTGPGGAFRSTIADGRIYGRGSCDMKGSLAAFLEASEKIDRSDIKRPLWVVCTADEEVGFAGIRRFRDHQQYASMLTHQPVAIIGEPTSMQVVHAHKGGERWDFTANGLAAHSGTDGGVNANEAIAPVLDELSKIATLSRRDRSLQNDAFDPNHLCINFGIENPASAVNITAAWARIWVFLRRMPGVDHEPLIERVVEVAKKNGVDAKRLDSVPPLHVSPEMPHIAGTSRLVGHPPRTVGFGTDGGELSDLSRRIVIGPGDIQQAHTSDEFIELAELQRGVEIYEQMIRNAVVEVS